MKNSHIEWTTHTFNGWIGCNKVSPGCLNCYAEARDRRFAGGVHWGTGALRQRTSEQNWNQPRTWNRAQRRFELNSADDVGRGDRPRVFSASLSDWLDDDQVPAAWLGDLLALIDECRFLNWQMLTKRPQNWEPRLRAAFAGLDASRPEVRTMVGNWLDGQPPDHVWVGTTVEDQARANLRIPQLVRIPARVRFLSVEPLLGPVDLAATPAGTRPALDWVIVGGESGRGARPMDIAWARGVRDQCVRLGIPFHFKQWGEHDAAGRPCPKKKAGRVLDGRTWDEFPAGFEPSAT